MVEQLGNDYPDRFAPITMHVNDDGFDTGWGQHRLDVFYGYAAAVPTFVVDASITCQISEYRYWVEQQMNIPTNVTIELSGSPEGGNKWDVTARVCLEGGSSKNMRIVMAATLDDFPNPPRHSTNTIRQDAFETNISLSGGSCENITNRISFDPESMANTSDIVIVAWAQNQTSTAPAVVYQAGIMRWPFPSGSQLATIEVTPVDVTMAIGDEIEFTATGKDQSGEDFPLENPTWSLGSTGSGGGSLDPSEGDTTTFTATTAGTRQVFCRDGDVSGAAIVHINEAAVLTTIEIDPSSTTVAVDGQIAFAATGKDQYGEDYGLTDPSWTVDGAGDGSFDPATGTETMFTATYPGSCVVTCTEGDVSATAEVEITGDAPRIDTIVLSPETIQLRVGDEIELVATAMDQYGRAIELTDPAWRIEGDGDGDFNPTDGSATTTFTATGEGSAQIICSEDGIDGAASIEIAPPGLPAPRRTTGRVTP